MSNLMPFNNPGSLYPNQVYANVKQPSMNQPLTREEQAELAQRGGGFNTQLSRQEVLRSMCTHKNENGWVLNRNGDGTFTCPICQETFTETDLGQEHVKEIADEFFNIMQMIKTYYVDIPVDTARELFPMMALAKRLPEYAQIALSNFAQYERGALVNNGSNAYGFAAYNTLMAGNQMMYGGGYPQQPMGYAPQMQPGYAPQPAGYPQQPMGYAPQMQPGYAPQQPMQQPAPGFTPNNEFGGYAPVNAPSPMVNPAMQYSAVPQQQAPVYQQPAPQAQQQMPVPQQAQPQQPAQQQAPAQNGQSVSVDTSSFSI